MGDLEQKARELLAAEYERECCPNSAMECRNGNTRECVSVPAGIAIRVISAALASRPEIDLSKLIVDAFMAGNQRGHESTVEGYWSDDRDIGVEYSTLIAGETK